MKLIAEKIEKKYPRKKKGEWIEILKQTQFVLESGKITAVTGRSGSGKSTLLYILSGLLKRQSDLEGSGFISADGPGQGRDSE